MRLVTYESNGGWRAGVQVDEKVVDTTAAARAASMGTVSEPVTNRQVIQWDTAQQAALEAAARSLAGGYSVGPAVFSTQDIRLGPPIPDPDKIICLGLNYRSHAEEAGLTPPVVPILFAKFRNALTGPTSPILLPGVSQEIDYEAELGVVIGKRGKDIPNGEALAYVAGYMAFHDVSARDLQFRTGQWFSGKALDSFAPCGPALVVNEIEDPQNLAISTRVNGQTVQQSNTCNMIFPVAETLTYISQLLTLEPGDIIATGTPEGVGFKRTPPIFLRDGDMVEVEVEGIGVLKNPVIRK